MASRRYQRIDLLRSLVCVMVLAWVIPALFWLISRHQFEMSGNRVLSGVAKLTYPVYLLREYIGDVFVTRLAESGLSYALCILLAVAAVCLAAYGVHLYIERPLSKVVRRAVAGG